MRDSVNAAKLKVVKISLYLITKIVINTENTKYTF